MAIPISYNIRNLFVRRTATLMTAGGIALVVAILIMSLALAHGFRATLVVENQGVTPLENVAVQLDIRDFNSNPADSLFGIAPPVVFLCGNGDVATGVEAMKLGAVDFLVKPVDGEALIAAVRKALERHAGERQRSLEREACRGLVARLSAREREVLEHVIRGRLNKQIAADLDIAEQTVKQHRGRVMEKLEVRSVPELVRACEASGLFIAPGRSPARTPAD
jgi:DNA-binding NarL/FixJ family response regulator